jgi:CHAT domain-containing protein
MFVGASKFAPDQKQRHLSTLDVQTEAKQITRSRPNSPKPLLNEDFTLDKFVKYRKTNPQPIVHLATYTNFNRANLQDSYVQFYNQRLTMQDWSFMNLSIPKVDLLVLPNSNTNIGGNQRDIELGFNALSLQSGARTSLATLWNVPDGANFALITGFYDNLAKFNTKAKAVQEAQRMMLERRVPLRDDNVLSPRRNKLSPDMSHPYYWAPFTVIGTPW